MTVLSEVPSEAVWTLNRLRGKPIRVSLVGGASDEGTVSGASVIGMVLSLRKGSGIDETYVRHELAAIESVETFGA